MAIVLNGTGTITGISTGGISATKAIADAAMPQGAVINQVTVNEYGTVSASVGEGAYSSALISVSYAAASSSNKLLIIAQFNISVADTTAASCATLHVAGSPSYRGSADGNRTRVTTSARPGNSGGVENQTIVHLMSNPSTSSTAYDIRGGHNNDQTHTVYLNRTGTDSNQTYEARCASSITIMEFVG